MIETITLSIIALFLVLGNILLKTKEEKKEIKLAEEELKTEVYSPYLFPIEERSEREKNLYVQGKELSEKINNIEKTLSFLNKKEDLINQRINSIENKIRKINFNNNSNHNDFILKKIEKLEDFKRNTIIEIEAIKQNLKETNKANEKLTKQINKEKELKKIHEIIFHSKK